MTLRKHGIVAALPVILAMNGALGADEVKPLMKDFIGLNGHFTFRPELYKQVCCKVRNYHNMDWDVSRPGAPLTFPVCVNRVDWTRDAYGPWTRQGFEVDVCVQFNRFGQDVPDYRDLWKGRGQLAFDYGYEMARCFGPSGRDKLCTSIEIGNEPGSEFDDSLYTSIFTNMAKGIRSADPKVKIVTCACKSGSPDTYIKSLAQTFSAPGVKELFDVISLHVYATKKDRQGQSPWERSYPEDPDIEYLKTVDEAIAWRNRNARGKEIWITEFGWDACTPDAMKNRSGWFKKLNWTGVTDLQQANYLVRSCFCLAERDIGRAYIYFYNDENVPSVHAASGLTRKFEPKASFWAVKHLYETLGGYRMNRVVLKQKDDVYAYEFSHGSNKNLLVWAVWSPTGTGRTAETALRGLPGTLLKIEGMPVSGGVAPVIGYQRIGGDAIQLPITESPVYLTFDKRR